MGGQNLFNSLPLQIILVQTPNSSDGSVILFTLIFVYSFFYKHIYTIFLFPLFYTTFFLLVYFYTLLILIISIYFIIYYFYLFILILTFLYCTFYTSFYTHFLNEIQQFFMIVVKKQFLFTKTAHYLIHAAYYCT